MCVQYSSAYLNGFHNGIHVVRLIVTVILNCTVWSLPFFGLSFLISYRCVLLLSIFHCFMHCPIMCMQLCVYSGYKVLYNIFVYVGL